MQETKRGLAFRERRSSRSIGDRFQSDVHQRRAGRGHMRRRRTAASGGGAG